MTLTNLQHQVVQSTEAISTLLVYLPILVLAIPLVLLYFPLRSLRMSSSWLTTFSHGLTNSMHQRSP